MQSFKRYLEEQNKLDQIQAALDVAGFEPTVGTTADAANTIISGLRAALTKEPDERKKHIINAGISAISLVPFADVIKVLKLRKYKPAAKAAISGARGLKTYGKSEQASNRFNTSLQEKKEKRRLDPKCWKGYRKAGTKLKDGTRVNKCIKVNR
jgi:hypothetical protein